MPVGAWSGRKITYISKAYYPNAKRQALNDTEANLSTYLSILRNLKLQKSSMSNPGTLSSNVHLGLKIKTLTQGGYSGSQTAYYIYDLQARRRRGCEL
eukprot:6200497-Pleurochrysis_carterae.AAC.2